MKKIFAGIFLGFVLFIIASPTHAAEIQIKVDGVPVTTDVKPEIKNNRTMVPLRVIGESLGFQVEWSDSEVTLTKSDTNIVLNLNSNKAVKNGKTVLLDVKPYVKNNRTIVPLRFLAETFDCKVSYKNAMVTVDTEALFIDGVKVKAMQQEYHMTMGGKVEQVKGNAYNEAIYRIFEENKGVKVEAPANYGWHYDIDTPGFYSKNAQYDFIDQEGNSIKRFDIYSIVYSGQTPPGYTGVLVYEASENQWYLFNDTASESIDQLINTARENGFLKIISNTVV